MAEETINQPVSTPESTGGLVGMGQAFLDKVKGPVFWLAIGFVACKVLDRKKKRIVSV